MPGCSQGVFPRSEISEGLLCHQIKVGWCQAVHRGYFLVLRLVKDCCVIRSRSGGARLFTGGITACMLGSAPALYFLCALLDFVKHGVLTHVSEIPHYRNDCYYY